jgi:hypothetical protein
MKWRIRYEVSPRRGLGGYKPIHTRIEALRSNGWSTVGFLQFDAAEWDAFNILMGPDVEIIDELAEPPAEGVRP